MTLSPPPQAHTLPTVISRSQLPTEMYLPLSLLRLKQQLQSSSRTKHHRIWISSLLLIHDIWLYKSNSWITATTSNSRWHVWREARLNVGATIMLATHSIAVQVTSFVRWRHLPFLRCLHYHLILIMITWLIKMIIMDGDNLHYQKFIVFQWKHYQNEDAPQCHCWGWCLHDTLQRGSCCLAEIACVSVVLMSSLMSKWDEGSRACGWNIFWFDWNWDLPKCSLS